MNLTAVDWVIILVCFTVITAGGIFARKYMKSVADFIVAGRGVGKFLGMSAGSAADMGLVSVAVAAQEGFRRGPAYLFMSLFSFVNTIFYGLSGFVIYRFRQTRAMTIPEFFEMRYSRNLRFLAGILAAVAGILNMAMFPILGSRFLVYLTGMPEYFNIMGLSVNAVQLVMGILIALALFYTFLGGMVSVLITDYVQSVIIAVALFGVTFLTLRQVSVGAMKEAVTSAYGAGGFNPFSQEGYGPAWIAWQLMLGVLGTAVFAPTLLRISSAKSPKVAKQIFTIMAFMSPGRGVMMVIWGIAALAVLGVAVPAGMDPNIYNQVATPMFLSNLVPPIMMGVLVAGMLAAAISTHDSYFLTWGSVVVNDVICPVAKKPLSQKGHIWLLRIVIALIALFEFFWGVVYVPGESMYNYLALTWTIYAAGAGLIMIGGLYWKGATSAGAFAALVVGAIIPTADILGRQILGHWGIEFPFSQTISGVLAYAGAVTAFIVVSLLTKRGEHVDELFAKFGAKAEESSSAQG